MYQTNTIIKIISDQKILFRFHIRVFFLIRPGMGQGEDFMRKYVTKVVSLCKWPENVMVYQYTLDTRQIMRKRISCLVKKIFF